MSLCGRLNGSSTLETTTSGRDTQDDNIEENDIVKFRAPLHIPIIVSFYACCMLTAWSIICVFSRRLIVPFPKHPGDNLELEISKPEADAQSCINVNARWYRAARVLWGIVSVMTLPLASAVCSFVAVGYVQTQNYHKRMPNLRQTLTLADRGWTSPRVVFSMFRHPRKEATSLLWAALALHLVGGIISPLQQLLVGQGTGTIILPQTELQTIFDITSLTDTHSLAYTDSGTAVALLRPRLVTAGNGAVSDYLWAGNSSCRLNKLISRDADSLFKCQRASLNSVPHTEANVTLDLFTSSMPSTANTGMLRQFAPRMNSSLAWTDIDSGDFPKNCSEGNGFFRNYTSPTDPASEEFYSLSVCMQGNLSHTPFKETRDRQDFEETIFLSTGYYVSGTGLGNATWRLTLSSTLGYFELPNKKRKNAYGPLLDKDPLANCTPPRCNGRQRPSSMSPNYGYDKDGRWYLDLVPSKGPLATLTLALFGNGSFIDTSNRNISDTFHRTSAQDSVCYGYNPLSLIMGEDERCSSSDSSGDRVATWVSSLSETSYAISALSQAALLADHAVLMSARGGETLTIYEKKGVDYPRPEISTVSMTILWLLISIYLSALIMLCVLATMSVPWADSLDSHAMVAMAASLRSRENSRNDDGLGEKADLLDYLPGYVGDAEPDSPVGRLGVGADSPLRWNRRYWKKKDLAF
ncbi:hypothetical protein N7452_010879 [Penicillium brevicompactum]|uniref:Uncharacterized protein n=1 Tax=Penicillium brevicompactum TaxID=5074 RepID=A0A9W9Q0Z6_PENBR|nr:hypothetical protein N7452_010879 [Penicillium brevicompactum]